MDIGTAKLPSAAARHRPPPARRARRDPGGERRRVPGGGPRRHRGDRRARPPRRCSWAGPACTSGRRSTGWRSRPPTPRCGRGSSSRPSAWVARRCTGRLRASDPVAARGRSCRATCAGSCGPWRSIELTGRPFSATLPEREFVSAHSDARPPGRPRTSSTTASTGGCERMWAARAASRRRERLLGDGLRDGVHGSPRDRVQPGDRGDRRRRSTRTRPRADTARRPVATPGGRRRGSAPTRASSGSMPPAPDLLDRALAAVREADAGSRHGIPENG